MKPAWIILNVILALAISFQALADSSPRAPASSYTCKYRTGDVGEIIGTGSSKSEAFKDAVNTCFDRRVSLFEKNRGVKVSMDRGQDIIDSCINLTCL